MKERKTLCQHGPIDFLCLQLNATGLLGVKQGFQVAPPEGIAKLVYVLLYDSLAKLVQGALAIRHAGK